MSSTVVLRVDKSLIRVIAFRARAAISRSLDAAENALTDSRTLSRKTGEIRLAPSNAWNPVNVLKRSGAGGEFRSWARQKNVNFWSAAARRVCESRVLNSLSSRPSFKSAWNSRGGRGGGRFDRRTIHDKLVSRLEESLVNSSHPENCFQMLYRVQYTGCPKNVGTNWRRSWYNFLMEKKYSLEEWLWKEGFVSEKFE